MDTDFMSITSLIRLRNEASPSVIAVQAGDRTLTYGELFIQVESLALMLRDRGVKSGDVVAIYVNRSIEMILALLAVLDAGGVYLPLDISAPTSRIRSMLIESDAKLLLTQNSFSQTAPRDIPTICVESALLQGVGGVGVPMSISSSDAAYILYTSGSSGQPKAVVVEHDSLKWYALSARDLFELTTQDRVLQFASFGFDTHIEEIFPCLLAGACLVLRSEEMLVSARQFFAACRAFEITAVMLPTAFWHELAYQLELEPTLLPTHLRLVSFGGEQARSDCLSSWQRAAGSHVRLLNGYGPSETTVCATFSDLSLRGMNSVAEASHLLPVGHPLPSVRVHLVDKKGDAVVRGSVGEVYIEGSGLARGYLKQPSLTAERFVPNHLFPNLSSRLYRTGDLGRIRVDGQLEILGREDRQHKIRGFRVELGEVEAALLRHPHIAEAAVVTVTASTGEPALRAYVVAGGKVDAQEVRRHLEQLVPDYMVPPRIEFLPRLPVSTNGKTDWSALRLLSEKESISAATSEDTSKTENVVASVWREILQLEEIGVLDNFFCLGGHSLQAVRLISRVRQLFAVDLKFSSLADVSTIRAMSCLIDSGLSAAPFTENTPSSCRLPERCPTSFAQEAVWIVQKMQPNQRAYNFQALMHFDGPLDTNHLTRALQSLVDRHEILRTSFEEWNGELFQKVHSWQRVVLEQIDLTEFPQEVRPERMESIVAQEFGHTFDISASPLIRWTLVKMSPTHNIMIHVEHHLVHDGVSFGIFLRELRELYTAARLEREAMLEPLSFQYANYAVWQRDWMRSKQAKSELQYWEQTLAGHEWSVSLPTRSSRSSMITGEGDIYLHRLRNGLGIAARALAQRHDSTLFMVMMAVFQVLLCRYSGQTEFCVGTAVGNRALEGSEQLIGMFVNTVPILASIDSSSTFDQVLWSVRTRTLEALARQQVPFSKVVERLRPERIGARLPIYQVGFSFHDSPMVDSHFHDLCLRIDDERGNGATKFELCPIVMPRRDQGVSLDPDEIVIAWEFSTELFDRETVIRMASHYENLLSQAVFAAHQHVSTMSMLEKGEQELILSEWSAS